jgi:[NiFe] hydrogenase assembly HybE family chaperone
MSESRPSNKPDQLPSNDPSPRLVRAFSAIAARMQGLGFCNPALCVEAVGFAPWQAHWLGVMVTPWSINLMLVPRTADALPPAAGQTQRHRFPAGDYDFIGGQDAEIGPYQMCSLFSPPAFADQATAREVALIARAALLDLPDGRRAAAASGHAANATNSMSKRDFLRGRFLNGVSG